MRYLPTLALAGALALVGCAEPETPYADDEQVAPAPVETAPEGVMVGGAMMLPTQTIVENAAAADNLTTLVGLVQQAGLAETLSGAGPFTVFAPPNTAFEAVPEETLQPLTLEENKEQLTSVLTYHVVPGRYTAADLQDGQELTTVNGATLTVSIENGNVKINGATVTIPDIEASNGVVHAIDAVLLPPM